MNGIRNPQSGAGPLGRAGLVALLAGVLAFAAAGCGDSAKPAKSVASTAASKGATSSAKPSATGSGDPVALAQCMRKNGVPNFPDPDASGGLALNPAKGVDPGSASFKAAQAKCQQYMPAGGSSSGSGESWSSADKLKYAKCMRNSGVPRFPDPTSEGQFPAFDASSGVDPLSAQFKRAETACAKYQPKNMAKQPPPAGGGS